jgi:thiamine-phosphate pyrophosphorylase
MQKKFSHLYYFVNEYNFSELSILNKNVHIIYRNYKKNLEVSTLILLKNFCKKNNKKLLISNNIKLALKYKLDGVYIPAFNNQLNFIKFCFPKKFLVIGSAHNQYEIFTKQKQGCSLIFLSPIFKIAKSKFFLDIVKFNLLTINIKKEFIALGGIDLKNFKKLSMLNICGIAGISIFKKKRPLNRGR